MTYLHNVWAVLKADGIDLDKTEGALIGVPSGETISLYAAMQARHGVFLARVACLFFSVAIQPGHCHKQLIGAPMKPVNYVRAMICLAAAPVLMILVIRWIV